MGYRSQEEALRAQLEDAQLRVEEIDEERALLETRAKRAEAKAELYRQLMDVPSWQSVRQWVGAPIALGVAVFALAFALAVIGDDALAELVVLGSIAAFTIGPMLGWARANRPIGGIAFVILKGSWIVVAAIWWGWFLPHDERPFVAFRFFYWVPAVLFATALIELLLLRSGSATSGRAGDPNQVD